MVGVRGADAGPVHQQRPADVLEVGTEVVNALLGRGASVRVLTRKKEAKLPVGAEVAVGDLLDPDSVRAALDGADKLFLLVANAAGEPTQALQPSSRAHRGVGLPSLRRAAEALQYLVEGRPFDRVLLEI